MPVKTGITRILDFELQSNKDIPNGYAGLDGFGLIAASQIPDLFVKTAGDTMTGTLVMSGAQINMSGEYLNMGSPNCGIQRVLNKLQFIDPNNLGGLYLDDLHKFIGMSDVPAAYAGAGSKYVCVNAAANALEFVAAGAIPGGPYLPLTGGTLTGDVAVDAGHTIDGIDISTISSTYVKLVGDTMTGTLTINMAMAPGIWLNETGSGEGAYIYYASPALFINSDAFVDISCLALNTNAPITIRDDSAALYFKNTLGTAKGALIPYDTNLLLASAATQDLKLDTGAAGKSIYLDTNGTTRLTIADAGLTSTVPLAMGTNKITGLAAATNNGDALRYEQLVGAYLPIGGGTLTGPLTIQNDSAALYFKNTLGNTKGALIPYTSELVLTSDATQDLVLDAASNAKSIRLSIIGTDQVVVTVTETTITGPIYNNGATSALYFDNPAGGADLGKLIPYADHLLLSSSAAQDLHLDTGANTKNILLKNATTTIATVTKDNITMAKPIAMGASKITGLAAATANGDATRYEQVLLLGGGTMSGAIAMGANKITGLAAATASGGACTLDQRTTWTMEVCDNNVGVNPLDATTYYFGHIGVAATSTANAEIHLRHVTANGNLTQAVITMYATTAGTAENISVYIRKNNTTDYLVQTVGVSALVRVFIGAFAQAFVQGDTFEIKIVYPTWATNPLGVTWDGTVMFKSTGP